MKNILVQFSKVLLLFLCSQAWAQPPEVRWETVIEGYGKEQAQLGDELSLSYVLTLADGTLVEATPEGNSYRLVLGEKKVIPGFEQGLLGIRRGETRRITIPPELGYGEQDMGPIPAGSTLQFEVKMLFFVKGDTDLELHEKFGRDGFENRPDARNLDLPAMFEYLIRDFFTRPWRYEDSPILIWKSNAVLTLIAVLLDIILFREKRRHEERR